MLILTRKASERIFVDLEDGRRIEVRVVEIDRDRVRIGIAAPDSIRINREEVALRSASAAAPR